MPEDSAALTLTMKHGRPLRNTCTQVCILTPVSRRTYTPGLSRARDDGDGDGEASDCQVVKVCVCKRRAPLAVTDSLLTPADPHVL